MVSSSHWRSGYLSRKPGMGRSGGGGGASSTGSLATSTGLSGATRDLARTVSPRTCQVPIVNNLSRIRFKRSAEGIRPRGALQSARVIRRQTRVSTCPLVGASCVNARFRRRGNWVVDMVSGKNLRRPTRSRDASYIKKKMVSGLRAVWRVSPGTDGGGQEILFLDCLILSHLIRLVEITTRKKKQKPSISRRRDKI